MNLLVWNVRGVGNPAARRRLRRLYQKYKFVCVVLLEPLVSASGLSSLSSYLGFSFSQSFINNKVWVFWGASLSPPFLEVGDQIVHMSVSCWNFPVVAFSFVYAKCTRSARRSLWSGLADVASPSVPWLMAGDFNIISRASERKGGAEPSVGAMSDFSSAIEDCELLDAGLSVLVDLTAEPGLALKTTCSNLIYSWKIRGSVLS